MARIRYIKPEMATDEDLAECSIAARYFFALLWCFCDRDGRCEDRPRKLKAFIFPWDDIDVDEILNELQPHFLVRYVGDDGRRYLQVRAFAKHQKVHVHEAPSTIQAPKESDLGGSSTTKGGASTTKGGASTTKVHTRPPIKGDGELGLGRGTGSSEAGFAEFWEAYPRKDRKKDAEKAWCALRPDSALQKLMLNAVEKHKSSPQWTKDGGNFIPYPATWICGELWENKGVSGLAQGHQPATSDSSKPVEYHRKRVGNTVTFGAHFPSETEEDYDFRMVAEKFEIDKEYNATRPHEAPKR